MSSNTATSSGSIDWQQVHARLEQAQTDLDKPPLPGQEEQKKILHERAVALAQPAPRPDDTKDFIEFTAFLLQEEAYGIESILLRAVLPLTDLTPLPAVPGFVAGTINFRGQILTVLDLRVCFGLSQEKAPGQEFVLVLQTPGGEVGLLAQKILGIQRCARNQLQPVVTTTPATVAAFVQGLTPERLTLLDANKLLADAKLRVYEVVGNEG